MTILIIRELSITGIVTFGGCAARLSASTGMLAHNTTIHNAKLLLAKNKTESNVKGRIIPICPMIPSPS